MIYANVKYKKSFLNYSIKKGMIYYEFIAMAWSREGWKMVLNYITNLFKGFEQSLGLPLWAVLTISAGCFLFVFFYGFYVPISMIRIKKNLNNLIHVLTTPPKKVKIISQKQGSKYRWKT